MSLRPARIIFPVALLAAVCAVEGNAQQTTKTPATETQAAAGKETKTAQAAPQQPAQAGGMVVFIDPATGKIRQPDAAEIGTLSGGTGAPANASGANTPAAARRPVAMPTIIHMPGGAIGIKLGEDSLSYMVVTRTADGKLTEDCVTGDAAAASLLSKGVTPQTTAAKKTKEPLDDK